MVGPGDPKQILENRDGSVDSVLSFSELIM